MPAKPSAQKRHRQSLKRRQQNRSWKKQIHTAEKDFLSRLEGKKTDGAADSLKRVSRLLSRAAGRGVTHRRTASRKISRLSKKLAKAR